LSYLQIRYSLDFLQWNFFATSHGKGCVDGVGGTVKRLVWNKVKSRKVTVTGAEDFVNALKNDSISTVECVYVNNEAAIYNELEVNVKDACKVKTKIPLFNSIRFCNHFCLFRYRTFAHPIVG